MNKPTYLKVFFLLGRFAGLSDSLNSKDFIIKKKIKKKIREHDFYFAVKLYTQYI